MTATPDLYQKYLDSQSRVQTDTRKLDGQPCLFFALSGPNFNGNQFAMQALEQGATFAVVDDEKLAASHKQLLHVNNSLEALQDLARYRRRQFNIPFVSVCGSNGKTTTKELMAAALQGHVKTFATPGNFNNHIGVPLTLLSMPADTELAIIEMGANGPHEIAQLCQIAEPTHGLITNIGYDHLEGFGNIDGVAAANGELFAFLKENSGTAFINTSEPYLQNLAAGINQTVTYHLPNDNYHCAWVDGPSTFLEVKDHTNTVFGTQLYGLYNFANIATALCVAHHFGVAAEKARQGISQYIPANNRSQMIDTGQNTVISDAYNANPSSMEAALQAFAAAHPANNLVILGDMLEMGNEKIAMHQKIINLATALPLDEIWLCGPAFKETLIRMNGFFEKVAVFNNTMQVIEHLQNRPAKGKHILLKGSRGLKLEQLVPYL